MAGCDLCGKDSSLIRAEIEGVLLNVCNSCGRHGKILGDIPKRVAVAPKKRIIREEIEETLIPDFSERIKLIREKKELNQEDFARLLNEKWSQIQKWENGVAVPDVETAKRISRTLGAELIEEVKEKKIELEKIKSDALTLGDCIKIRKRN